MSPVICPILQRRKLGLTKASDLLWVAQWLSGSPRVWWLNLCAVTCQILRLFCARPGVPAQQASFHYLIMTFGAGTALMWSYRQGHGLIEAQWLALVTQLTSGGPGTRLLVCLTPEPLLFSTGLQLRGCWGGSGGGIFLQARGRINWDRSKSWI